MDDRTSSIDGRTRRVVAIASGGGHWVQLRRLAAAFEGHDLAYVTTLPGYRTEIEPARFYVVRDASRWSKCSLLVTAVQLLWVMLRERPHVVISTGAAPGYLGLRLGKLLGARTVWLDSMANVEELSLSGRHAGACADLWLTQWPHLVQEGGPYYLGAVL